MRRAAIVGMLLFAACEEPSEMTTCEPAALPDDALEADREACTFEAGARVEETLGVDRAAASSIPITHVLVRMQENRSYDHYLGQLPRMGQPDAEAIPADFTAIGTDGADVAPFHLDSTCLEADPPHQWEAMNANWNFGAMDGFVTSAAVDGSDGVYTMGYYDASDLPFVYWLASTFVVGDRNFSDSLGGTWSNRNFLYTGSAHGVKNTFDDVISDARTVFDELDAAGVPWAVYVDGGWPRQDTLGWNDMTPGVRPFSELLERLADGTLEPVVFVDTAPGTAFDEHPPFDVQPGEEWTRMIYEAARQSPLWEQLALILTYDTAGGMLDHVPPPEACVPAAGEEDFDRYGLRVPLMIVSAWARPSYVSHVRHSHSSVLRFIELIHDLPALSARDANADALLDAFDFSCPPAFAEAPEAPAAGTGGCP